MICDLYAITEIKHYISLAELELSHLLETDIKTLRASSLHLLNSGGKRLRPALVFLSALCTNRHLDDVLKYAAVVEGIHLATLIHDDVIDEASMRRGQPSVNGKYGFKIAILSGDFVLAKITHFLSLLENREPVKFMAEVIMRMSEGEVMQQEDLFQIVSVERYILRCINKTARLISYSSLLGVIDDLDIRDKFAEFGLNLGIAFQIIDDILDFSGEQKKLGKVPGSDLKSGIVTLPVLLLANKIKDLAELLKNTSKNFDLILNLVKSERTLVESAQIAKNYSSRALNCLKGLNLNDTYLNILKGYVKRLEERVS